MECPFCNNLVLSRNNACLKQIPAKFGTYVLCSRVGWHSGMHVGCLHQAHGHTYTLPTLDEDYLTFPLTKGLYENR